MKSLLLVLELILNKPQAVLELILKNHRAVLQLVICVALLAFAVYIIVTPMQTPAAVDFAFTILGTMLGKILKW
jgi:hypothetical protein